MADTANRNTSTTPARKQRTRNTNVQTAIQQFSAADIAQIAQAAAAGAVMGVLNPHGVQTEGFIGGQPQGSQSGSQSQMGQARSTPTRSSSKAVKTAAESRPGRRPDPKSQLSQAKVRYAELKAKGWERSDIVKNFINDLGIKDGVANTYYHIAAGAKTPPTAGTTRGRGRPRSNGNNKPAKAAATA